MLIPVNLLMANVMGFLPFYTQPWRRADLGVDNYRTFPPMTGWRINIIHQVKIKHVMKSSHLKSLFRAQEYKNFMVEKGKVSGKNVNCMDAVTSGLPGSWAWFITTKLQLRTPKSFYIYYMIKSISVRFYSVLKGDFPSPFIFWSARQVI